MRRFLTLSSVGLVLGVAVVLFVYRTTPEVEVRVAEVQIREIRETVAAVGSIQPKMQVRVDAQTAGQVKALYFTENGQVKEGQLLVQLDDTELSQQLLQAQASLRQAQTTLAMSEKTLQRTQLLFKKGYVAQEELETAQHQVAVNRATVTERQANVAAIQARRDLMAITAPISGVVIRKYVEEGETVRGVAGTGAPSSSAVASATPLALIAALDSLEVHANVDETEIGKIHAGQEALVTVDAFPDETLVGAVTEIALANAETNGSGVNYLVKVALDSSRTVALRLGMTANVEFILARKTEATAIPVLTILEKGGGEYVFVVAGTSVRERRIHTGIRDADYIEVLSGVKAGERVVYGDLGRLQNGMAVQISEIVE